MRALALASAIAVFLALTVALVVPLANTSAKVTGEVGGVPVLRIEPPPSVERAGGRTLAEFKLGRRVAVETGCLACHRIGSQGNRGPGGTLTHVGSRLSSPAIRRAILHARAPMPSFPGLPKTKLEGLVVFLSFLR